MPAASLTEKIRGAVPARDYKLFDREIRSRELSGPQSEFNSVWRGIRTDIAANRIKNCFSKQLEQSADAPHKKTNETENGIGAVSLANFPDVLKHPFFRETDSGSMLEFVKDIWKNNDNSYGGNLLYYSQALRHGICGFIDAGSRLVPVTHTGASPLQFAIIGPINDGSENTNSIK